MRKRLPLLAAALCAGFAFIFSGGLRAAPGDLDTAFNPNVSGTVYSTTVQPDGKIIVGGFFTTLQPNGTATATTRNHIARLANDPVLQRLTVSGPTGGATVQLLRTGALPEVQQVTFEASVDGGAT